MKHSLAVGLTHEAAYEVDRDQVAPHLPRPVLATPTMIGLIEHTCAAATMTHLDDGETTVGTHVCVSHEGPASPGEQVVVRCRLARIDRRRLTFDVEVDSPRATISRGTHERAVVDLARYRGT